MTLKALLFVRPIFAAGFLLGNLSPQKLLNASLTVARVVDLPQRAHFSIPFPLK